MLTKEYGPKYVHEDHSYDKNNAGYANAGFLPKQIWCSCKLKKCLGQQLCANVQSLVTKQPILSQNETRSKRKRPTFLVALGDFLYKV